MELLKVDEEVQDLLDSISMSLKVYLPNRKISWEQYKFGTVSIASDYYWVFLQVKNNCVIGYSLVWEQIGFENVLIRTEIETILNQYVKR